MRKTLPASVVTPGHPDNALLSSIADELERMAGGKGQLAQEVPDLLREVIDDVIQTPRTGRRSYDELEKTEKTYIGTRVEIMLRALLTLPKGKLDAVVLGHDLDIKHTMGDNWMIPLEALGHPCILVAADEVRARCYMGLIVAKPEYLHGGKGNRDVKRGVSAAGFANILWIFADQPYPPNFWRTVPPDAVDRIFSGSSGNARVMSLFREVQGVPVSRETVQGVARQKDFMRRIRADDGKGTRDKLAAEGILLLSSTYDGPLMRALGLPDGDFVSYTPTTADELDAAREAGWPV
ncbi:NaeI family type II restriction endonuclease [Sagittula sp.]|uniref:NaeI family type II restriction endonuclease n=1 Tax=Sagittula sp. TaxID=2038081 RepID=UPI0035199460